MKLQEIMNDKKATQNSLAKASGVSQAHISRILAGKMQPTLPVIQKLAAALDVSISELVGEGQEVKTG